MSISFGTHRYTQNRKVCWSSASRSSASRDGYRLFVQYSCVGSFMGTRSSVYFSGGRWVSVWINRLCRCVCVCVHGMHKEESLVNSERIPGWKGYFLFRAPLGTKCRLPPVDHRPPGPQVVNPSKAIRLASPVSDRPFASHCRVIFEQLRFTS